MSISFVLVTFLFQMAVGMMLTVAILPPALVDRRFFKSISFWATVFVILSLILKQYSRFELPAAFGVFLFQGADRFGTILLLLFGLLCLQLWGRIRFREVQVSKWELILIAFVGLVAVVADSLLFLPRTQPSWVQQLLIPLSFVSASLILGGFLTGMIFGHWYLVNTDMPKRLLVTIAWILIGILLLRIASVGSTLLLYQSVIRPDADFLQALVSFQGHGIFFWQRILVGLVIPAIVVIMIWKTARIGSNQSATGIMYVAIAFVFIGELAARYLFLMSAIPL